MPPFCVLHVCMGNICRSPMAERLFVLAARERVGGKADELLLVHSAGTGGWHAGEEMNPPAAREVRRRGGDTGDFAARKLRGDLLDSADLVLTATAEQQHFVLGLRPDAAARTFVLGEFGRLLRALDPAVLPPVAMPALAMPAEAALVQAAPAHPVPVTGAAGDGPPGLTPDAVYARGVALVAAVAALRGDAPPELGDDLDDPWGRGDAYFRRVADEIDQTVRPLASILLPG